MAAKLDMDKLVSLCRRRGFIFQSSEIYGGINGFWDYGPLGVELKKNIKDAWWHDMVRNPPPGPNGEEISMVGLDCSIIMNPKVWVASGHVGGFADPMVDCKETRARYRADQLLCFPVKTADHEAETQIGYVAIVGDRSAMVEIVDNRSRKFFERVESAFKKRKPSIEIGFEKRFSDLEAYERATVLGP